MRWTEHVARMGRGEVNAGFFFCWGNLREGDYFDDPVVKWQDNIKMGLQELGCGGVYWMDLAQDRDR